MKITKSQIVAAVMAILTALATVNDQLPVIQQILTVPHWLVVALQLSAVVILPLCRSWLPGNSGQPASSDAATAGAPRNGVNSPRQGGFAVIPAGAPKSMMAADKRVMQHKAASFARAQVGQCETPKGSNWGPYVQKLLAICGLTKPASWCMAFVVYVFYTVGYLSVNGVQLLLKSASCQEQADHAKSLGLLVAANAAIGAGLDIGWVMLQWHPELKRYAHTGVILAVDLDAKTFECCEGNTNDTGGREGQAVLIHTRRVLDKCDDGHWKYAFIRTA